MARSSIAITLFLFATIAFGDLYLHNPRGCNDRLNEANTNRNNANRLFDSQNNAKGGYCVGPAMTFYEGSLLSVEWTAQHGCGSNPKMVCNIVLQYMCGFNDADALIRIRDGTTTNTIPDNEAGATDVQDDGTLTYGMHESYQSYQNCKARNRNTGLFIADRETEGNLVAGRASSIFTRQNNNGQRFGYECTEERDYYPYWAPSEWRDIAIMAHSTDYCDFYKSESENVKGRGYCKDPKSETDTVAAPNNPSDCAQKGFTWQTSSSHGIAAPDCVQVPWSRENHLGSGTDGFTNRYNMTIPKSKDLPCAKDDKCVCVMRLRYNISTTEDGYPDMSRPDSGFIDSSNNAAASPILEDPVVSLNSGTLELELAVDTSQFGRTFQDRTHTFKISKRPKGISQSSRLYNLNVRGKRGNIVQTYPATEYDFVPQYLYAKVGDYIHFQWTGCDTNPAGNAGEGSDQTDRSNCVQIINGDSSKPATEEWATKNKKKTLFDSPELRLRMANIDQTDCLTREELLAENGNNANAAEQDERNCGKLNAASQYFDGGVIKMNKTGTFHYMSTRNHNFSNRDQKGIIYIVPFLPSWAVGVVVAGGVLTAAAGAVAGMMFYAKLHPHSGVANIFSKM